MWRHVHTHSCARRNNVVLVCGTEDDEKGCGTVNKTPKKAGSCARPNLGLEIMESRHQKVLLAAATLLLMQREVRSSISSINEGVQVSTVPSPTDPFPSFWQIRLNRDFYMQLRKSKALDRHTRPRRLGVFQVFPSERDHGAGDILAILLDLVCCDLFSHQMGREVSFIFSG